MDHIQEQIRGTVSSVLALPPDSLEPDSVIFALPNMDSMRALEIIVALEKALGIEIPDEVTFNLTTLGEFEDMVQQLCAGPAVGASAPPE